MCLYMFFKQKTAFEMRISDGSSDVCSSDLLAGSTLTMAGAVANMIAQGRVSLRTAVTMASATPAAFLGLADRTGTIAAGFAADLVLADDALTVERTWIAGQAA